MEMLSTRGRNKSKHKIAGTKVGKIVEGKKTYVRRKFKNEYFN